VETLPSERGRNRTTADHISGEHRIWPIAQQPFLRAVILVFRDRSFSIPKMKDGKTVLDGNIHQSGPNPSGEPVAKGLVQPAREQNRRPLKASLDDIQDIRPAHREEIFEKNVEGDLGITHPSDGTCEILAEFKNLTWQLRVHGGDENDSVHSSGAQDSAQAFGTEGEILKLKQVRAVSRLFGMVKRPSQLCAGRGFVLQPLA